MKRVATAILISCLCIVAVLCVAQSRRAVLFHLRVLAGLPLDEASAQDPRIGQYKEHTADDPAFDYLIYYFDGTKGANPAEIAAAGLRAVRRGGFKHTKKMTLVVFCDLTAYSKASEIVYPFGVFLESDTIRSRTIGVANFASGPFITHPMNWDSRINEWIYTTNNSAKNGPDVVENADYTRSTNALDRGWFMALHDLANKAQVYANFGVPRYFVREFGGYSEIYPVNDTNRSQAGAARIWYDGDRVTKTGCYMTNK